MTYQHPPGFSVPDPRYNDPLSTEYVRKLQNQIKTLVDSIAQPVLNSDLTPEGKAAVLSYHLLNAILVLHLHIAEVYYDDPD